MIAPGAPAPAPARRRAGGRLPALLVAGALLLAALPSAAGAAPLVEDGRPAPEEEPAVVPALAFQDAPPPLERGLALRGPAGPRLPDPEPWPPRPPSPRPAGVIPAEPDWGGILRDTGYLVGYQALAFGVLWVSPESVSRWSTEQKHGYDFSKYVDNVRHPVVDKDKFWINYVAHPYCGAVYFLDARGRGFGPWGSFFYAVLASGLYEFGTEAFAEPASVQDIFVTPIGGALLGMAVEGYWLELLEKGESRRWWDSVTLFLIDPLGRSNHAVDRLFGFGQGKPAVRVLPVVGPTTGRGVYGGVELSMQW
jgi:hypothetical protein